MEDVNENQRTLATPDSFEIQLIVVITRKTKREGERQKKISNTGGGGHLRCHDGRDLQQWCWYLRGWWHPWWKPVTATVFGDIS
ncbi:hypothetical protein M8C21_005044, partial [Ambrosia artemisiifolia]